MSFVGKTMAEPQGPLDVNPQKNAHPAKTPNNIQQASHTRNLSSTESHPKLLDHGELVTAPRNAKVEITPVKCLISYEQQKLTIADDGDAEITIGLSCRHRINR